LSLFENVLVDSDEVCMANYLEMLPTSR